MVKCSSKNVSDLLIATVMRAPGGSLSVTTDATLRVCISTVLCPMHRHTMTEQLLVLISEDLTRHTILTHVPPSCTLRFPQYFMHNIINTSHYSIDLLLSISNAKKHTIREKKEIFCTLVHYPNLATF